MDILNILIDRVDNVNVFNLIQGRTPGRDTHLHTSVDQDLIQEFLDELERIAHLSNQVHEGGLSYDLYFLIFSFPHISYYLFVKFDGTILYSATNAFWCFLNLLS